MLDVCTTSGIIVSITLDDEIIKWHIVVGVCHSREVCFQHVTVKYPLKTLVFQVNSHLNMSNFNGLKTKVGHPCWMCAQHQELLLE